MSLLPQARIRSWSSILAQFLTIYSISSISIASKLPLFLFSYSFLCSHWFSNISFSPIYPLSYFLTDSSMLHNIWYIIFSHYFPFLHSFFHFPLPHVSILTLFSPIFAHVVLFIPFLHLNEFLKQISESKFNLFKFTSSLKTLPLTLHISNNCNNVFRPFKEVLC